MTSLPEILTDPEVEIVDSRTTVGESAFQRRRRPVESGANRAVAAVVRDDADRLLLVRHRGEDTYDGWRLPGSAVGAVTDFVGRLEEAVASKLGVRLADPTPRWVYRQIGVHDGETAPLFYVLCEATLDRDPAATSDDLEIGWFGSPPDALVNSDVVRDRLGG